MTYVLSVGGVRIRVRDARAADARPSASLRGAVAKYFVADDGPVDLDAVVETLDAEPPAPQKPLFESGGIWRISDEGDSYRIDCAVHGEIYKYAVVSRDFTRATVRLRDEQYPMTYPLDYPLDEVLVNQLLARRGAVEIHACGVVDVNGDGYLFAGNSRAGKTTTARLWQHDAAEILSDDRIVLRRENGTWWMYGTPWHGEAEISSASRAPLTRIFLLEQATANAVKTISPAASVARLFSCAFPPFHDAAAVGAVTSTLAVLAAEVPVSRFAFVNDHSAVDFIRSSAEVAA